LEISFAYARAKRVQRKLANEDGLELLRFSSLAPDILRDTLSDHEPQRLSIKPLTALDLPASWAGQRPRLGLAEPAK